VVPAATASQHRRGLHQVASFDRCHSLA
jgi:hypothetical protein